VPSRKHLVCRLGSTIARLKLNGIGGDALQGVDAAV
jgi:hypothetical protein